jgi:hypothetical protein
VGSFQFVAPLRASWRGAIGCGRTVRSQRTDFVNRRDACKLSGVVRGFTQPVKNILHKPKKHHHTSDRSVRVSGISKNIGRLPQWVIHRIIRLVTTSPTRHSGRGVVASHKAYSGTVPKCGSCGASVSVGGTATGSSQLRRKPNHKRTTSCNSSNRGRRTTTKSDSSQHSVRKSLNLSDRVGGFFASAPPCASRRGAVANTKNLAGLSLRRCPYTQIARLPHGQTG